MVERSTPDVLCRPDQRAAESAGCLLGAAEIGVPTLLLSGSEDAWSPVSQHETMRRRIPHATVFEIHGGGPHGAYRAAGRRRRGAARVAGQDLIPGRCGRCGRSGAQLSGTPFWLYFGQGDSNDVIRRIGICALLIALGWQAERWRAIRAHSRPYLHGQPQGTLGLGVVRQRARIEAVGTDAQILKHRGSGAQVIDLHGQTVIPGIVDSHTHMLFGAYALHGLNLSTPRIQHHPGQAGIFWSSASGPTRRRIRTMPCCSAARISAPCRRRRRRMRCSTARWRTARS